MIDGKLTYEAVAEAHGLEYRPLEELAASRARLGLGSVDGFGLVRRAGQSLTTTHVTPAAKRDHADDPDDDAEESEDGVHPGTRIAAPCRAPA